MRNIHNLAREYLSKAGLNLKDTQKASVMQFADWLLPITETAEFDKAAELKAKDAVIEAAREYREAVRSMNRKALSSQAEFDKRSARYVKAGVDLDAALAKATP